MLEWIIIGIIIFGIIGLIIYDIIPKNSKISESLEEPEELHPQKTRKKVSSVAWCIIGNIIQIAIPSVTFFIITVDLLNSFGFLYLYAIYVFRDFLKNSGKTLKSLMFWCAIFFTGHIFIYSITHLTLWDTRIKILCVSGIIGVIINIFFQHKSDIAYYSS